MRTKQQKESPKRKISDKEQEEKRIKHFEQLAKPKKVFSELLSAANKSKTFKAPDPKRLKQLSRPLMKNSDTEKKNWKLTKALKNYKPSKRLCELSEPRKYAIENENYFKVEPQALTYRATTRIKQMSKPLKIYSKIVDQKEQNPFKVSRKALKAKSTQRLDELAYPRQYIDVHVKENPFQISKNALKSKASKRIKMLAQPKNFHY
ncbi:uncharacterized protein ACRADG_012872 [Cochliomyia hominivorax]